MRRNQPIVNIPKDSNEKVLNPHIPKYIVRKPWYSTNLQEDDKLNHQRLGKEIEEKKKKKKANLNTWYKKGKDTIVYQSTKFRKGACKNCGSMDHKAKDCMERPRRKKAKFTNKNIAPDRQIENLDGKLDYAAKRDNWSNYDLDNYQEVFDKYKILEKERRKMLNQKFTKEQLKNRKDEDKKNLEEESDTFAVGAHDGKTRTSFRNLRGRDDIAKYLLNIEENAPFYEPKTRSLRGNPNEGKKDAFYKGDNANRYTGDYNAFKEVNYFAWEAQKRGKNLQLSTNPSKTELAHKEYLEKKKNLLKQTKKKILTNYGIQDNSTTKNLFPEPLNQKNHIPQNPRMKKKKIITSRYSEDVFVNGHSSVFGSYWKDGKWGYACCKQFDKYCECKLTSSKRKRLSL